MGRSIKRLATCTVEYEIMPDIQYRGVAIIYAWFGKKLIRLGWVSKNGTSGPEGFPIPTDAIEFAREFLGVTDHDEEMDPDMEITRVDLPKSNPSNPPPSKDDIRAAFVSGRKEQSSVDKLLHSSGQGNRRFI